VHFCGLPEQLQEALRIVRCAAGENGLNRLAIYVEGAAVHL